MAALASLEQALRVARLRLHRNILYASVGLSALLGGVLTFAVWDTQEPGRLLSWATCLALVLALRLGVGWAHGLAQPTDAVASSKWLLFYRLCFAAHGLVWGAVSWWLQDASGIAPFSLLTISVVAIAAGSLNSTTFDVRAGLAFGACAMSPMFVAIYLWGDTAAGIRGLVMLTFMLATLIGARRAERIFEEAEGLRLAEAQQAEEARQHAQAAEAARQDLAHKNYLLPLLLSTTRQGFWFVDRNGVTTDLNPAMCELLGRTRDEVVGHVVFDFFSDADLAVMRREIASRQQGVSGNYEVGLTRPDGSRRFCLNTATPMYDLQGQHVGSVGVWTDITARRASEMALRTYELVANSITDSVSAVGEDLRYRMVNDAWCRMTGQTREAVMGATTTEVLAIRFNTIRKQALKECLELQQVRVVQDLLQIGSQPPFQAETTYYPYADALVGETARCVVMVTRDISEQVLARQQLAESAMYLQRTLNATGDAIFASEAVDPNSPVHFANEQMLDMWGIPHEKMPTLTPMDIMAYATPQFLEPEAETSRVNDIIRTNQSHESRVRLRDGRTLLRRCIPANVGDRVLRVWSFRDITALEDALEAVQASEASYRALMDAFPGFITQVDQSLTYRYVNQRVAQRLNTTPQQMLGRTVREVVGEESEAWLLPFVEQVQTGEPVTYERRHDRGDADPVFDHVTLVKSTDWRTGGWVIYAFGIDITARKMAEQKLMETSTQLARKSAELQLTLDSIEQGIVSFDANGQLGINNRQALKLMDLPADLFDRLKTYDEIVRFQVQQGDLSGDASFIDAYGQRQYFKGGRANSPDLYVRKNASGSIIEVRTRHLANGGLVRTFAKVTDYFEAQQAVRETEIELRDLLGAFPGYILALDENFRYTFVSDSFAQLIGRTPADMLGRHPRDVVGEERFRFIETEVKLAWDGQRSVSHSSYPRVGDQAPVDMEVSLVTGRRRASGERTTYVFGIDVTARREAEAALIAARDAAESASRAKSDFLSRMSHELRTPMNAILGFGQLLELKHQSDQDRMDWGHEVVKGGRHLLQLINEVLDLARVESGKIAIRSEALALKPVMDDCLMLVRPQADARQLQIALKIVPADLRVMADPMRLKQVMLNLLGNAVKYNREGGNLTVLCEVIPGDFSDLPDRPGTVRISVSDTGNGLTAAQMEKLFQPFERLDAALKHIEGTGIGLVLAKRLVELMHGSIGVQTAPGQGSTFWFTLPLVA